MRSQCSNAKYQMEESLRQISLMCTANFTSCSGNFRQHYQMNNLIFKNKKSCLKSNFLRICNLMLISFCKTFECASF
jgi:hypothetical protein